MTQHYRAPLGRAMPTEAQNRNRGIALLSIRDAAKNLPPSEIARTFAEALSLAGWSPADIEGLGNDISRAGGELHRDALRAARLRADGGAA